MVEDVLRHQLNTFGSQICVFTVNVPNLLINDFLVDGHSLDVIHPEGQNILVIDSIHDGIGMELVAKRLLRGAELGIPVRTAVDRKNRSPGKAEQMVLLEVLYDSRVHITKLAAMTLIEDDDDVLRIYLVPLVLLDEGRQFLNGRDDDFGVGVFQLLFQDSRRSIGVGRTFLEAVILLHGLVVQILTVYHKQDLVDIRQFRCQSSSLKAGERFTASGGMPDISAARNRTILLVVVGDFDAVQNTLCGGDLIGTHDHQHIF